MDSHTIDFCNMSDADLREAIKLGNMNIDKIKPEFQADLLIRLDYLEAEWALRGWPAA